MAARPTDVLSPVWELQQVAELGPVNATIHKINECVNAADLQLPARMVNVLWNSSSPDERSG